MNQYGNVHARTPAGLRPDARTLAVLCAGVLLCLALQGCGSAASPRWAGSRSEPPADAADPRAGESRPGRAAPGAGTVPGADAPAGEAPTARSGSVPGEEASEAIVEVPALVPSGGPGYRIGVGDELTINFPFDRDLNGTAVVRPDGRITVPLLQEVPAAGRTAGELDSLLTREYARFYRRPEITVDISKLANNQVYVMGEVNVPGPVEISGSITLLQLIARAGGVRTSGTLKSVVLLHRGPGYQVHARRVNVARILEGRPDAPDILLAPTDIAYVPRSFIGKLNLFVEQYVTGLLSPVSSGYLHGWEIIQPDRFFFNPNTNRPSQSGGTSAGP
ncbi:MAG: polysaccharide biosynthesis/export family protein [Candidatus Eisenbacteria bacterium]|nr:polysaccharide biosynthesis/export family protein [Candidatus Eisenbacteria bacterium]